MYVCTKLVLTVACMVAPVVSAFGQSDDGNWLEMSDRAFAEKHVDMAINGSLKDRQKLAWMFFARVNQLIDDDTNGGMSGSDKVPLWMAWPTDPDTFGTTKPFVFRGVPRDDMRPSAEKKDIKVGTITTADPDAANEEVTRNEISYDYLVENGLTTKLDVAAFFAINDYVDMPVGSIELKASWLQVTKGSPAPTGAQTYKFDSGEYWWRGLHIMAKMKSLANPGDAFYTEEPSWFWTTFEFNNNPGVAHVRQTLITQREPLSQEEISGILGDLDGFGFEAYAPNGTQIRFTENGTGKMPVILGNTDMEDFAGSPNTAQPAYWNRFEASCHGCHATAAYNPTTSSFFPFSGAHGSVGPGL